MKKMKWDGYYFRTNPINANQMLTCQSSNKTSFKPSKIRYYFSVSIGNQLQMNNLNTIGISLECFLRMFRISRLCRLSIDVDCFQNSDAIHAFCSFKKILYYFKNYKLIK